MMRSCEFSRVRFDWLSHLLTRGGRRYFEILEDCHVHVGVRSILEERADYILPIRLVLLWTGTLNLTWKMMVAFKLNLRLGHYFLLSGQNCP